MAVVVAVVACVIGMICMMNKHQKREMRRLAMQYEVDSMWSYIQDMKDEYVNPNQFEKMRHRAVRKQCYKRAKREVLKMGRVDGCRDFTEEELIDYNKSIDKLFNPTGINIFDEKDG